MNPPGTFSAIGFAFQGTQTGIVPTSLEKGAEMSLSIQKNDTCTDEELFLLEDSHVARHTETFKDGILDACLCCLAV